MLTWLPTTQDQLDTELVQETYPWIFDKSIWLLSSHDNRMNFAIWLMLGIDISRIAYVSISELKETYEVLAFCTKSGGEEIMPLQLGRDEWIKVKQRLTILNS